MMRTACFVVLASLLLATVAGAATYTETIYIDSVNNATGDDWVALRGVPFNPDPAAVFGGLGRIDNNLSKFDPVGGNGILYMSGIEEFNLLLGEGYFIQASPSGGGTYTISYTGVADGVPDGEGNMTDMWISLPGLAEGLPGYPGGQHWIGHPFNHAVAWTDVEVTDGTQTISVVDACDPAGAYKWIEPFWTYRENSEQNAYAVDPDGITGDPNLLPGKMYQVFTHKANIALIIPA